jgi:hypothetical protein
MKIQEQIINNQNGTEYWKIYFELINAKQLTLLEWELINNAINRMIHDFNQNNQLKYKEVTNETNTSKGR